MVTGTIDNREGRSGNEVGVKMVVRGNKKLTCRATATEEEINKVFAQSDKTDKLRSEWQAKGSPWTEDDEAFLNRMSA